MATIQELAKRHAELEEELARVRQEIAARAGEVDRPAAKKTAVKK